MAYDDVLPYLGEFGRYQRRIYILLCLPAIVCAFHKLAGVFLQAKPDHRCKLPFEHNNASFVLPHEILNSSYSWDERANAWSGCNWINSSGVSTTCDVYVYDRTQYESSAVIEWDMVCEDAYLKATGDALFMFGVLVGSIVFGDLSDRCGRKPVFILSLVLQVIFGVFAGIAPEYFTFTFARMIIGMTTSGVFLVAYVIAMEMVGPSKRLFAGVVCQMFFTLGYVLTALFAYYIHDWRYLQIALTLPGLVFLCYWWLIPESTRWLLTKNRTEEAKVLIQKAAKENKVKISDELLDELLAVENNSVADKKEPSLFDLFRNPNLRKKSILIFFDWFVNSATYYGLSWNTATLGGNPLLNFVISGAVEFPAYTFLLFTLNRWGRKHILCGCMVTSGIMLLLTLVAPADASWMVVACAMFGKLAITASYGTIYVFSAEQFPTVIRNVGLGAASMFARIGGILAPYINLLSEVWKPLPLIIFGALALAGGMFSLLLPETLNKQLPESIADGERFGNREFQDEEKDKTGDVAEKQKLQTITVNGDVDKNDAKTDEIEEKLTT